MQERRPSPEDLLAAATAETRRAARGRLKIFFGAAPGVGKTYAMLEAAKARRKEGVDVVVGWLEPHARPATSAMAEGLERVPPRVVVHRGLELRDLDLDAVLARRPSLVLVDELAHTNAPGSAHDRRWRDVLALRDAGIDVYTTLNVQHVESLGDVVQRVTGVAPVETVPDAVVDDADEIALVDVPPDELLRRLAEGKVYLPEQAARAMHGFFEKGNLIALRELALRRTAECVDRAGADWRRAHGEQRVWATGERILVAVGPAPSSRALVRAARRMAVRLRAPWIALSVEGAGFDLLPRAERERAAAHLAYAETLGAETAVVRGDSVADEILAVARARNVTRVVVGRPRPPGVFGRRRRSLLDDLIGRSGDVDVIVTTGAEGADPPNPPRRSAGAVSWSAYAYAASGVGLAGAAAVLLRDHLSLVDLAMIHLLAALVAASRYGRGPTALAAVLAVASFDVFCVPPFGSFAVDDLRYLLTFIVMLATTTAFGGLAVRVREQAEAARSRERRTAALYALSRDLAGANDASDVADAACRHVRTLFDAGVAVRLADAEGRFVVRRGDVVDDPRAEAFARRAFDAAEPVGAGAELLPGADALYLPLVGSDGPLGVVAVAFGPRKVETSPAERQLLEVMLRQIAFALERTVLAAEAQREHVAAETERARSTLLSAVSHDLRTPLASIVGAAEVLLAEGARCDDAARRTLLETVRDEGDRLSRLVRNLLELTRIEGGALRPEREWTPAEEPLLSALRRLRTVLAGRDVRVDLPPEVVMVDADAALLENALANLLENAAKYGGEGPIDAGVRREDGHVVFEVADRGPGVAPGDEERIFERYYRAPDAGGAPGAGLGLAIVRAVAKVHGGRAEARPRPGGGAVFRLVVPIGDPPEDDAAGSTASGVEEPSR